MESEKRETHSEEESEAKHERKTQAPNLTQSFKFWLHQTHSIYWPNFIIGMIILFIGMPVAVFMSTRTGAIYALGIGLSLLAVLVIMSLAHYVAQRASSKSVQPSPVASIPLPETDAAPQIGIDSSPKPQSPATQKEQRTRKEPQVNKDESSRSDKSQTMTNAPGGYQAGRDIIINQAPQQQPLPIKNLTHYVKQISSPYPEYPYGLEIVLQTSVPVSTLHLRLEFDVPVYKHAKSFGALGGLFMNDAEYATPPNVYEFSTNPFPEFSPSKPMIINVYSDKAIHLTKIEVKQF